MDSGEKVCSNILRNYINLTVKIICPPFNYYYVKKHQLWLLEQRVPFFPIKPKILKTPIFKKSIYPPQNGNGVKPGGNHTFQKKRFISKICVS